MNCLLVVLQSDVCRINGKCYADGFVNPLNVNQICDVNTNNQWSTLNGIIVYTVNVEIY